MMRGKDVKHSVTIVVISMTVRVNPPWAVVQTINVCTHACVVSAGMY